jgi:hypothetical protein
MVLHLNSLGSRSPLLKMENGFQTIIRVRNEILLSSLVYSKLIIRPRLVLHLKPFGSRSQLLKIEKWFLDNKIELGMRYCNQTLYKASLYEDPGLDYN